MNRKYAYGKKRMAKYVEIDTYIDFGDGRRRKKSATRFNNGINI